MLFFFLFFPFLFRTRLPRPGTPATTSPAYVDLETLVSALSFHPLGSNGRLLALISNRSGMTLAHGRLPCCCRRQVKPLLWTTPLTGDNGLINRDIAWLAYTFTLAAQDAVPKSGSGCGEKCAMDPSHSQPRCLIPSYTGKQDSVHQVHYRAGCLEVGTKYSVIHIQTCRRHAR